MKITHNRKKSFVAAVGGAVAAAAVPAFLFAAAGTAQAGTTIDTTTDALGVSVNITSVGNWGAQSSGWCQYTAHPEGPGVPVDQLPFYLQVGGTHKLWFPASRRARNGMSSCIARTVSTARPRRCTTEHLGHVSGVVFAMDVARATPISLQLANSRP